MEPDQKIRKDEITLIEFFPLFFWRNNSSLYAALTGKAFEARYHRELFSVTLPKVLLIYTLLSDYIIL